jgi:cytochrome c553
MTRTLLLLLWLPLALSAHAGDAEAGKSKAVVCASCHGADGYSPNPLWPNLAGQQEQYLAKQLKAFREGTRSDPLMAPMAKSLSDQDIEDLSAYFASLPRSIHQ